MNTLIRDLVISALVGIGVSILAIVFAAFLLGVL